MKSLLMFAALACLAGCASIASAATADPVTGTANVKVTWTEPATNTDGSALDLSTVDYYRLDRAIGACASGMGTWETVAQPPAGTTGYTWANVSPGTYCMRMRTVLKDGTVGPVGVALTSTVEPPPPPVINKPIPSPPGSVTVTIIVTTVQ